MSTCKFWTLFTEEKVDPISMVDFERHVQELHNNRNHGFSLEFSVINTCICLCNPCSEKCCSVGTGQEHVCKSINFSSIIGMQQIKEPLRQCLAMYTLLLLVSLVLNMFDFSSLYQY
jgi:hypothetical protein